MGVRTRGSLMLTFIMSRLSESLRYPDVLLFLLGMARFSGKVFQAWLEGDTLGTARGWKLTLTTLTVTQCPVCGM